MRMTPKLPERITGEFLVAWTFCNMLPLSLLATGDVMEKQKTRELILH